MFDAIRDVGRSVFGSRTEGTGIWSSPAQEERVAESEARRAELESQLEAERLERELAERQAVAEEPPAGAPAGGIPMEYLAIGGAVVGLGLVLVLTQ